MFPWSLYWLHHTAPLSVRIVSVSLCWLSYWFLVFVITCYCVGLSCWLPVLWSCLVLVVVDVGMIRVLLLGNGCERSSVNRCVIFTIIICMYCKMMSWN